MSFSPNLRRLIEEKCQQGSYTSSEAYIQHLVERDQNKPGEDQTMGTEQSNDRVTPPAKGTGMGGVDHSKPKPKGVEAGSPAPKAKSEILSVEDFTRGLKHGAVLLAPRRAYFWTDPK